MACNEGERDQMERQRDEGEKQSLSENLITAHCLLYDKLCVFVARHLLDTTLSLHAHC